MPRKPIQTYYFSVDGQTEVYYLQRLGELINKEPDSVYHVAMKPKVENPISYVKKLNVMSRITVTHICDMESNDPVHTAAFKATLAALKKASGQGKTIDYRLGYSNFTFELWMILHKIDCNRSFTHRSQDLVPLNQAFQEQFSELSEYKPEPEFKRILRNISLEDVKHALTRAKTIMRRNQEHGVKLEEYKGYNYYANNPALTIGDAIEQILHDCRLL